MLNGTHGRWLAGREPDPRAEIRLFCLPYAGGSAAVYRRWQGLVPAGVQVCPIELPGRGGRLAEPPFHRLSSLVRALAAGLAPALDRPFALFGHSMGGLLGFELVRALRRASRPQPVHLFVSATRPPTSPARPPTPSADATDGELKERLRRLNGTPRVLLEDDELMSLMLPALRADFALMETYTYEDEPPLETPLTVFGGTDDPLAPATALHGWRTLSTEPRLRIVPGDHFFLHSAEKELVAAVTGALG